MLHFKFLLKIHILINYGIYNIINKNIIIEIIFYLFVIIFQHFKLLFFEIEYNK